MSSFQSSRPPPSLPPTITLTHPVDTSRAGQKVWLIKVPEIFAECVASDEAKGRIFGRITTLADNNSSVTSSSTSSSTNMSKSIISSSFKGKRSRIQLSVELDEETTRNIARSEEVYKRTPRSYQLTLDEPIGTRIFANSEDAGTPFVFLGAASQSGTLIPDTNDPAYAAFSSWRRALDKEKKAGRASTTVAETESITSSLARAREQQAAAARAIEEHVSSNRGGRTIVTGGVPRASSVIEMFGYGAYWTLKQIIEGTGAKNDADIHAEVRRLCLYLRSGEHSKCYILKPEFRTPSSPVATDDDLRRASAAVGL
jgi:hypothetical protein